VAALDTARRYAEVRQQVGPVSRKGATEALRRPDHVGLVSRSSSAANPRRSATRSPRSATPQFEPMAELPNWLAAHARELNLDESDKWLPDEDR